MLNSSKGDSLNVHMDESALLTIATFAQPTSFADKRYMEKYVCQAQTSICFWICLIADMFECMLQLDTQDRGITFYLPVAKTWRQR